MELEKVMINKCIEYLNNLQKSLDEELEEAKKEIRDRNKIVVLLATKNTSKLLKEYASEIKGI